MGQQHNELRRGGGVIGYAMSQAVGDSRGGGIERYGETLTPTLDLWSLPEWAYLRAEKLACFPVTQAAVAGEFSAAGLLNPAGSGQLAVVEKFMCDQSGTLIFQLQSCTQAQVATLATVVKGNGRDRRWQGGGALTACDVISGSDPTTTLGFNLDQVRAPGNTTIGFNTLPVVVPPGFALVAVALTNNTGVTFIMSWRERAAFPSEGAE